MVWRILSSQEEQTNASEVRSTNDMKALSDLGFEQRLSLDEPKVPDISGSEALSSVKSER